MSGGMDSEERLCGSERGGGYLRKEGKRVDGS